jgi:hypothetical protein
MPRKKDEVLERALNQDLKQDLNEPKVEEETKEETKEAPKEDIPRQLRYVGKSINHFSHEGVLYQLIPNTVYIGLPDCPQVRRLIENGELIEIK